MNTRILTCFLVLAACGDSHGADAGTDATTDATTDGRVDTGDCTGDVPDCYQGWDTEGRCCLESARASAMCVGRAWTCEDRFFLGSECGRIDPVCEGVDLGMPDAGSDADGGSSGLYDDCAATSECTLTSTSCCGVCGRPTAEDVAAVHVDERGRYFDEVACPGGPPPCPDCPTAPNPALFATCDMTGFRPACAVVDFETPEYASCETNADCVLAKPQCCACGDVPAHETIAVRNDADVNSVICDLGMGECPPCVPIFDPRAEAICVDGLCAVGLE